MDVKITPRKEKSQVELSISVTPEEFKPSIEKAAKELTAEKPLKGFRPGKAPLNVVIETFGKERVLREALDKAMPKYFVQAVIDNKVDAISRPNVTVDTLGVEEGLKFTAIVDVMPEVKLDGVGDISIEKRVVEASDDDIEQELTYLAKSRSQMIEVARPAEEGDTVMVDFAVKVNGELIEGGESKNHPVQIGDGHFVPGFEDNLKGLTAGDERDFSITFPDDFPNKELQGKNAEVHVKAHAVHKRVMPQLDDEFAKGLGKFESLQDLKDKLKKNIQEDKENKEKDRYRGTLMEKLAEKASFDVIPESLIEREIDRRLEELEQMLATQQRTVDQYLADQGKSAADMRTDMRPTAEKNVKIGLAMRAFAEEQDVKVTPDEIEAKAKEHLAQFPDPKEAEKHIDPEQLREEIGSVLRNQKTLDTLEAAVKIKEVKPKKEAKKEENKKEKKAA